MQTMKQYQKQPVALVCGMLEDNGRVLFLLKKDEHMVERLEMPCCLVFSGEDPVSRITKEFKEQTGIDGQVHECALEARHNAGSRRMKYAIPVLTFKITAKNMTARPSCRFSGFRWLGFDDVKRHRVGRMLEWIKTIR